MVETDPTAQAAGLADDIDLDEADLGVDGSGDGRARVDDAAPAGVEDTIVPELAAPEVADPTAVGDIDLATLGALGIVPVPPPVLPAVKRGVSGTYRSSSTPFQVELRVDVDGSRPTKRVSADYYSVAGKTVTYFGSMRVDTPKITVSPTTITITGTGTYTWKTGWPRVKITIPRVPRGTPLAAATLQHLTAGGAPGGAYICKWSSQYFRRVVLEEDRQNSVAATFVSYNTGLLPSGGPARTLSVPAAFAEAGIEMRSLGTPNVINTSEAGGGGTWSDPELHAAMVRHFSLWRDVPQWKVWLFHAQLHDRGPTLLGIMFDQQGKERQGAAVFYQSLAGTTADQQRLQLYTCTHELGHCFNLLHSWQKSLGSPPGTNRPGSYSWMNYPWRFAGGPTAFWTGFGFQFDEPELVHLRHAFRDDIVFGGNPFAVGSALEDTEGWRPPIEDASGLRLELSAPRSFPYGAPVAVDARLSSTDDQGKVVYRHLRPRNGALEIAIRKPNERVLVYQPLLHHCTAEETIVLDREQPSISETAFVGYGKDGFYFDQPGSYVLRARYVAPDGSMVISNPLTVRVQHPITTEDNEAADLVFGDEQGTLFYLVGSDFEGLRSGNEAFAELLERFPEHPLTSYVRVVQGVNAAREFKNVAADNTVTVRSARPDEAVELLTPEIPIGTMWENASAQEGDDLEKARAAARSLREQPVEQEGRDDLSAFVRSRRREIATEVAAHAQ